MRADHIHDGPLDGTRLSAEITRDFPGLHRSIRHAEWRGDLKRRVRERLAATPPSTPEEPNDAG